MKTTDDTSDIYLMVATLPIYLQEALHAESVGSEPARHLVIQPE